MHIFHVITTLDKGGAESHLVALCRGQRARGADVTLVYLKGDGFWAPTFEAMGVRTIALGSTRYADPGAILRLRRELHRAAPDIVHAHMPPAELYTRIVLGLRPRQPLVISKHIDRFRFYPGPGSDWLERWSASPAAAVICISHAVHDYFAERWPTTLRRKLVTIHYGLEAISSSDAEGAARELRKDWGVRDNEVLFGIAARFVEQKSIDTLLRAFAMLLQSTSEPVRLAIVGRGPLEANLRALASELGIQDQVVWGGFQTNIPAVMRAFDVFVLSSIYEGFGLVLLEAMEASRPIIASGVSAIPEVVADGTTGLLVPPQQPAALAEAMGQLLDPAVRARMAAEGRKRLIEVFGVDRMIDQTMNVYTDVLSGGQRSPGQNEPHHDSPR
jgi:glycosyltransferase involved in cell wall biosynthesis